MAAKKPVVGFIGQGYVGGSYANNFEKRGFPTIRYSLEEPHIRNKDRVREAEIVFVCVPAPTTPKGFDSSILREALALVRPGATAVIKSTLLPGLTVQLQKQYPKITVLYSPEFLSVATAQEDTDRPFVTIVGTPQKTARHKKAAARTLELLPKAPFDQICSSEEAEVIKYAHNLSGYTQILTFNLMYDMAKRIGASWDPINRAMEADPLVPNRYSNPIHKGGRGAGGYCFVKDMAAFSRSYKKLVGRPEGVRFIEAMEKKNLALLRETEKDLHIVESVYGKRAARGTGARAKKKRVR